MIKIWEIQNSQVHGRTNKEQEQKQNSHQIQELKNLFAKKDDLQPIDIILFPENDDNFIEKCIGQGIADYVSMHEKAILNSANEQKRCLIKGVKTILGWLQNDLKNAKPIQCTALHVDIIIA